jgi:formylglycine-generating enzyme required for sulfatase activity
MGFDYDGELAGNTAAGKVHDLIQQMKRRGRLQELLDAAAEERPSVDWLKLDLVQGESAAEPARGAGEAWTDGPEGYTDQKTGLLMLPVPAGEFLFGEDKRVQYLPAYWIAKTPVTNALYVRFIAASGHEPPEHWEGSGPPVAIADHPVTFVSWHDAFEYANWAGMRLPTEQEWEKAARGTDGRIYPWGNTWRDGVCNTNDDGIWGPTPVGKYSPVGDSPTGCVDMAGNVWEWTIWCRVRGVQRQFRYGGR